MGTPRWLRAGALWLAYGVWTGLFKLLALTFVTYFMRASSPKLEEIAESLGAVELNLMGFSALGFLALLVSLPPMIHIDRREYWSTERLEKRFAPGFFHGAVLAIGLAVVFVASGNAKYLGFFMQTEGTPMALASLALRATSLVTLAYVEEFIFRSLLLRGGIAPLALSLLYCLTKWQQFDLGWMQLATLFLLSLSLSLRARSSGDFGQGAGFWCALLLLFHPLLSFPIFGNEVSGVILLRPQTEPGTLGNLLRWLTGGVGGPLSSVALQALLVFDIFRARTLKSSPT